MVFPSPAPADIAAWCRLALDALAHPLLLVRVDGTVLYANPAGQQALASGGVWQRNSHGHLQPRDAALKGPFAAALKAAAGGPAQTFNSATSGATSATLQMLTPLGTAPAALLIALPRATAGAADVQAFSLRYALTDAEARVLDQLLLGHSAQQAAAAIGVSTSTVRSQVLSLRRKTGHRSVPALLAALHALPALWPAPPQG